MGRGKIDDIPQTIKALFWARGLGWLEWRDKTLYLCPVARTKIHKGQGAVLEWELCKLLGQHICAEAGQ